MVFRGPGMARAAAVLLAAAAVLSACSSDGGSAGTSARAVRFSADDGVDLAGEVRGGGNRGVVLAHMFGSDRGAWSELVEVLVDRDYRTLAFDFRGFGESEGEQDPTSAPLDLLAAVEALRADGARSIVVIGASMGGTAALVAAARDEVALDGVVTLSAPAVFLGLAASDDVVEAVEEPKLFIAAEGDGTAPASAQGFYNVSAPPKRVEIVVGDDHGTALLASPQAEAVRSLILNFLDRTSAD